MARDTNMGLRMNKAIAERRGRRSAGRAAGLLMAALATIGAAPPVDGGTPTAVLAALRDGDLRLARIGYRLATANAALCDRLQPGTGLQLHSLGQYAPASRAAAKAFFGFATPAGVEGVVPGSSAARADVHPNDALAQIGTSSVASLVGETPAEASSAGLVALDAALAKLPPDQPIELSLVRDGAPIRRTIRPVPACRTRFELRIGSGFDAQADGTMVQIGSRFLDDYDDAGLAAVVAHELAHNILHHRERLEARGVDFGMLAGVGANVKYFRQTETQADLLSVYLLVNAGYDPAIAPAFWRRFGASAGGGILRDRTHPAWQDRVATIEHEIAQLPKDASKPIVPPLVATRSQPLDGNWQAILIRR